MKKIVSLIVVFSVISSLFIAPIYAADAKDEAFPCGAESLIKHLNILHDGFNGDGIVKRRDFARMLAIVVTGGRVNEIAPQDLTIIDVPVTDDDYNSIAILYSYGITRGSNDGRFYPDEDIDFYDALKLVARGMGVPYTDGMEYYNFLQRCKIIKKVVPSGRKITFHNAAMLIYNMLLSDDGFTILDNGAILYSNMSVLEKNFSIYKIEGIVTDNGITSIYGKSEVSKGSCVIGGVTMESLAEYDNILGLDVTAYYLETKDTNTLLCLEKSKDQELEIRSKNIEKYKDSTYYYYEDYYDSRAAKAYLEKGFTVVYNGKTVVGTDIFTEDNMTVQSGNIRLVDNNHDRKYDIVFINKYTDYIVNQVDLESEILYLKGKNIEYDKDNILVLDSNGNDVGLNYIQPAMVVSIGDSFDGEYTIIRCSDKSVDGSIDSIDEEYMIVNGAAYRYDTNLKKLLFVDFYGHIYINFDNIIVYAEELPSEYIYGYLIKSAIKEGLDSKLMLKIFSAIGNIQIYDVAKRVTIDEVLYKTCDDMYNALLNSSGEMATIIRYKVNHKFEINAIDTLNTTFDESEVHLREFNVAKGKEPVYRAKSINGKCLVDEKTAFFFIPDDMDENKMRITSVSSFVEGTFTGSVLKGAYYSNPNSYLADVVILGGESLYPNTHMNCYPSLVRSVSRTLNEEGDEVFAVELSNCQMGDYTVYTDDDDALKFVVGEDTYYISEGDIITYGIGSNLIEKGNVTVIYDRSEDWFYSDVMAATDYSLGKDIKIGYAYSKTDNGIQMTFVKPTDAIQDDVYVYGLNNITTFYVSEGKNGMRFRKGTINDFLTYKDNNVENKVILYTRYGQPYTVFIYND